MPYLRTLSTRHKKSRTVFASLVTALGVGITAFYLTRIFLMRDLFPRESNKQSVLDVKEACLE